MSLPPELLLLAEEHPCFAGVWDRAEESECVVDPGRSEPVVTLYCSDCLGYRIGVAQRLLGGIGARTVPKLLSDHVRSRRGYGFSISGYHASGNGFWLSAAWIPRLGALLLDVTHGQKRGSDALEQLLEAFRLGVVKPPQPGMANRLAYRTHDLFVKAAPGLTSPTVAHLLASGEVSSRPQPGFVRATLAEYVPGRIGVVPASIGGHAPPPPRPAVPPRPLVEGEICPVCGEEVESRSR